MDVTGRYTDVTGCYMDIIVKTLQDVTGCYRKLHRRYMDVTRTLHKLNRTLWTIEATGFYKYDFVFDAIEPFNNSKIGPCRNSRTNHHCNQVSDRHGQFGVFVEPVCHNLAEIKAA